ncbi:MAG: UDP-2,3-diacylglucosamine diphosphatase LpxI [Psychrilyobacter sp.]|uniref:LpxI family protein n=1 Tax=Psychrilyobacter sp. TaxID=2586924 RepID=UPI003C773F52
MEKIAIIVGNGDLPVKFLESAKEYGIDPYPIGLFDTVSEKVKTHDNYLEMNIGEMKKIILYLLTNNIEKMVMLGKVEKKLLFNDLKLDEVGEELLKKMPDKKDETLLFGLISLFRLNGIKVLPQNHLMKDMMFSENTYTKAIPNSEENKTIKIGIEGARALSIIDAGQCVVCKDGSIITLEGIEGTDKTIERAYEYAGNNCILVKMARPQQDMRVDIPAIGLDTIKKIISIGGRGIVAEADKMLFLDKEECIKLANNNNIFIVGVKV